MNQSNYSSVPLAALVAAITLASLLLTPVGKANALTNCSTNSEGIDSSEQELLGLINQARSNAGVQTLALSPNLNRAAAWKSEDSSAGIPLSHTDSLGRNPSQRAQDCGYPGPAGENIAVGFPSASSVFAAWMNSTGHRNNILSPNYVVIGIGRSGSAWTTDFGLDFDGGSPPAPSNTPVATSTQPGAPNPTSTSVPPRPTQPAQPTQPSAPSPTATTPAASPTASTPNGRAPNNVIAVLSPGFNLVTYSGPRMLAEDAFDSLIGVQIWVYGWNANANEWERFFRPAPDYLNTLNSVEPGQAYMIWVGQHVIWGQ